MSDWRERIETEKPGSPAIKGSGVEVEAVLRLLRDGGSVERVLAEFRVLAPEDVQACLDYSLDLLHREQLRAEIRRRLAEDDRFPERAVPHEQVAAELLAGLPEDDE